MTSPKHKIHRTMMCTQCFSAHMKSLIKYLLCIMLPCSAHTETLCKLLTWQRSEQTPNCLRKIVKNIKQISSICNSHFIEFHPNITKLASGTDFIKKFLPSWESHICKGSKGVVHPPDNDPVRYPHPPFDFQRLGPPLKFIVCGTPLWKNQNFSSGRLKLMKFWWKLLKSNYFLLFLSGNISVFLAIFH